MIPHTFLHQMLPWGLPLRVHLSDHLHPTFLNNQHQAQVPQPLLRLISLPRDTNCWVSYISECMPTSWNPLQRIPQCRDHCTEPSSGRARCPLHAARSSAPATRRGTASGMRAGTPCTHLRPRPSAPRTYGTRCSACSSDAPAVHQTNIIATTLFLQCNEVRRPSLKHSTRPRGLVIYVYDLALSTVPGRARWH